MTNYFVHLCFCLSFQSYHANFLLFNRQCLAVLFHIFIHSDRSDYIRIDTTILKKIIFSFIFISNFCRTVFNLMASNLIPVLFQLSANIMQHFLHPLFLSLTSIFVWGTIHFIHEFIRIYPFFITVTLFWDFVKLPHLLR